MPSRETMLDREFQYYIDHQGELVAKYNGKWLIIVGHTVVGTSTTWKGAIKKAQKTYEVGTFLIQECSPGPDSYTSYFYGHRVTF